MKTIRFLSQTALFAFVVLLTNLTFQGIPQASSSVGARASDKSCTALTVDDDE